MSLRAAALEALQNRKDEEAATARVIAENIAKAGVKRVGKSPLGKWFPQVEWEFVADLADGATVVREKGYDLLLGALLTKDGSVGEGSDEWEVAVYQRSDGVLGRGFRKIRVLKAAADLGAYIDETEPKLADEPQNQGDS